MSTAVDTLKTEFTLEDDFTPAFKSLIGTLRSGLNTITGVATSLAGIGVGLGRDFLAAGFGAIRAAADIETLKMGLTAITGSAQETERQFARLKQLAKLPGLDLEPLIKGSIALQSAGLSSREAEQAMAKFGNALAIAGGKAEDLEGVIYGIGRLSRSPSVLESDLEMIQSRVPQISKMLEKLYGSSRSEDIAELGITGKQLITDLVAELAKMPQAAGGTNNAFANLGAAWQSFQVALASPLLPLVTETVERFALAMENLEGSGVLKKIGEDLAKAFGGTAISEVFITVLTWLVATLEEIPKLIREVRNTFALQFNEVRTVLLKTVTAFVEVMATMVAAEGLVALIEFFITLRKVIAGAAAIQAAMLMMTGVGVAALMAGLVAAVATYEFLDSAIPRMEPAKKGEGLPGRLGNVQRRQQELFKIATTPLKPVPEEEKKIAVEATAAGKDPQVANAPDWRAHTNYLREIANNTRQIGERRIIGGGGYSSMAANDLGFSKAVGGPSKLDRIKRMLDEYMRELVASEVGTSNRRLGYSPVRQ